MLSIGGRDDTRRDEVKKDLQILWLAWEERGAADTSHRVASECGPVRPQGRGLNQCCGQGQVVSNGKCRSGKRLWANVVHPRRRQCRCHGGDSNDRLTITTSGVARICCEEGQSLKVGLGALTANFRALCSSCLMTNSFVTNAVLIEKAVSC